MTVQNGVTLRNDRLAAWETSLGASPVLEIRSGPQPANCAASATGTVLATLTLPADPMAAPSGGSSAKQGTWGDSSTDAAGKPGHYRIWNSAKTVCHEQGIAAGPWMASTAYVIGDTVTNDSGKVYKATAAGTSASSGGPTGTGGAITDGGVTWAYQQAAADMALDSGVWNAGQDFSITAFNKTAGNA